MNIAIDLSGAFAPPIRGRGIGNYTISHIKQIIECDDINYYFLLNLYSDMNIEDVFAPQKNVYIFNFYTGPASFLVYDPLYSDILGNIYRNFILEYDIDLFWLTYTFNPLTCYDIEWFMDTKVIITVYDLIPLLFQDEYLANQQVQEWFFSCCDFLKKCHYFFVISKSVAQDLMDQLGIHQDSIFIIYAGVDRKYTLLDITSADMQETLDKHGINRPYILSVAGEDYRKNIDGLIEAFAKLEKPIQLRYQLVFTCKVNDSTRERYMHLAKRYNVNDRIIFTGFVDDEDLVRLYNGAIVMAFPSKYEGFGLPALEAMACGTVVLTSDNSSLGEIAKDAAILVNPYNVIDIAKGLELVLTTCSHARLLQKGFSKLKQYTWERSALLAIEAFSQIENTKSMAPHFDKDIVSIIVDFASMQSPYVEKIVAWLSSECSVQIIHDLSQGRVAKCKKTISVISPEHTSIHRAALYIQNSEVVHLLPSRQGANTFCHTLHAYVNDKNCLRGKIFCVYNKTDHRELLKAVSDCRVCFLDDNVSAKFYCKAIDNLTTVTIKTNKIESIVERFYNENTIITHKNIKNISYTLAFAQQTILSANSNEIVDRHL